MALAEDGGVDLTETKRLRAEDRLVSDRIVIGVDVGGTFTDVFLLDEEGDGGSRKVPSTADPSAA